LFYVVIILAKKEELASDLLQAFPEIKENFDIIKKVGEGNMFLIFVISN